MAVLHHAPGIGDAEHCRLPDTIRSSLAVPVGAQVRVVHDGLPALFTVRDGVRPAVGSGGRARLGAAGDRFPAALDPAVVSASDRETAKADGGLVCRVRDGGPVAALAPHGGHVEPGTDQQARRLADRGATAWWCAGFWPGGGAFERWHVTSNDLSPVSFPGLDRLMAAAVDRAVSFHGWSRSGVGVGGGASRAVRAAVADALDAAIPAPVELVPAGRYRGDAPANVVNRVGDRGGVQLEQGIDVRADHWAAVADAVGSVLR